MASTHTPARGRTGRRALLTLAVAGGVVLAPLPAVAAPAEPTTSAEAATLIAERGHALEVITEEFHAATDALTAQQAAAAEAAAQLAAADAAVVEARSHVREVARSAFTGEQLTSLQAMLTSESADQVLERMGTLDSIAGHNNEVLADAQGASEAADEAKAAAEESAAEAKNQVDQVASKQAGLNAEIAEYQAEYDRLSAEEQARARELAEQHAASVAAAAAAAAATEERVSSRPASRAERPSASAAAPAATPVVASSSAAQAAVDTAMAQRGKPYVWAATGPSSFDCSGLVKYAYAAAGVSLPRSSSQQATVGRAVSRAELQPGDIIAFYSPVSHVGIYIGNGQMVHAPTSGDVVKVASIDAMGSITAMRRVAG